MTRDGAPGGGTVLSIVDSYRALAAAQKGHARGAPAYSVYVNRRMGRFFAAVAHRLGLTPNQASAISAVHTFLAIGLIAAAPVEAWTGFVAAALLALGYAWDSADGQLARLRGGGTVQGEWLDHFIDALKLSSLHLAVLVGLYRAIPDQPVLLLIPLVFSIASSTGFAGMLLNDLLKSTRGVASTHQRGGGTLGRSVLLLPTDFGLVCLVFVFWGWPALFLVFYGLLALVAVLFLAAAAVKWSREMRAIGADGAS
ncbi:CDP-alcohol phosphatidyltransferase family protein [Microbacterium sp.]|uniref:CDP-alcohol phosphatidyltransferase family protein n=1 Tax=Microbacterium sp. TaxID=51671 RepID=UPI0039E4D0F4